MSRRRSPVEPRDVAFEAVLPGLVYVQNISIRNLASVARRVRIEPPGPKGPFQLVYTPGIALAPGLDFVAEIRFHLPDDESAGVLEDERQTGVFRDRLLVRFGEDSSPVEVPLTARVPQPSIHVVSTPSATSEKTRAASEKYTVECVGGSGQYAVKLGQVVLGSTTTASIVLTNTGPVEGSFTMDCASIDKNQLSVEPASGTLGADNTAYAKLVQTLQKVDAMDQEIIDKLKSRCSFDLPPRLRLQLTFKANESLRSVPQCRVI